MLCLTITGMDRPRWVEMTNLAPCDVPQCLVDYKSSVQEEQDFTTCQAIVVHQLVQSWLASYVVYNLASYGPELYAGTATPDASVNSHIVIEKSQGRVNLV